MTKKNTPEKRLQHELARSNCVTIYTENGSCSKIENCKSCPLSSGKSKSREAGRSAEKKKKNQTRMFFRLGRESMTSRASTLSKRSFSGCLFEKLRIEGRSSAAIHMRSRRMCRDSRKRINFGRVNTETRRTRTVSGTDKERLRAASLKTNDTLATWQVRCLYSVTLKNSRLGCEEGIQSCGCEKPL